MGSSITEFYLVLILDFSFFFIVLSKIAKEQCTMFFKIEILDKICSEEGKGNKSNLVMKRTYYCKMGFHTIQEDNYQSI